MTRDRRDWPEWHRAYDDPDSALSKRLHIVTGMIRNHLDQAAPGPIRVLSLCAGEGRDLAAAAHGHRRATDLAGALVEYDHTLVERAAANLRAAGLDLEVRKADAGVTENFRDVLPVDLLLLVGIFGNISDDDVHNTINAVPNLCRPGATILWTRHRREPDLTPKIREWFDAIGCRPIEFVSEGIGRFAVGSEFLVERADLPPTPEKLFTFRDDLW